MYILTTICTILATVFTPAMLKKFSPIDRWHDKERGYLSDQWKSMKEILSTPSKHEMRKNNASMPIRIFRASCFCLRPCAWNLSRLFIHQDESLFGHGHHLDHLLDPLAVKRDFTESLSGLTRTQADGYNVRQGQRLLKAVRILLGGRCMESYARRSVSCTQSPCTSLVCVCVCVCVYGLPVGCPSTLVTISSFGPPESCTTAIKPLA